MGSKLGPNPEKPQQSGAPLPAPILPFTSRIPLGLPQFRPIHQSSYLTNRAATVRRRRHTNIPALQPIFPSCSAQEFGTDRR